MFSPLFGTYFSLKMDFQISAICFNLDESKVLSSGNGLSSICKDYPVSELQISGKNVISKYKALRIVSNPKL